MAADGDWCLIESDPGVFTELIKGFGVKGVQVEELYCLDLNHLREFWPIHGLIFLFKYHAGEEPTGKLDPEAKGVYFAQQVINNACATQAIMNLLLNVQHEDVKLGETLENFRSFSKELDPASRGLCLSNSEDIRKLHNSFSRPTLVEIEQPRQGKEDSYHFVTYVPVNGHVYELDGLKEAPIDIGAISEGKDWLDVVHGVLNDRVNSLIQSTLDLEEKANQEARLNMLIHDEEDKLQRYKDENLRRRHNYTPFIVELLKVLAKENKLNGLVEKALKEEENKRKTGAN